MAEVVFSPHARVLKVTDEEYYADPCAVPSLSYSTAKRLINESPAHAWLYHPRLGGVAEDPSNAMDRGSLVDSLLLGGKGVVVVEGFADWRKKEAKQQREAARNAGKVPCLTHEYEAARHTAERIRAQLDDFGLSLDGSSQLAIEWTEFADNGNAVLCRGKLDNFSLSSALIWDLKVRDNVRPDACEKQIITMGYDIQGAAYTSAVSKLFPELAGRLSFVNLFAEADRPHCLTPLLFAGSMAELGRMKWQRAINTWEECFRLNKWPGYLTRIGRAEAPIWELTRELEQHGTHV